MADAEGESKVSLSRRTEAVLGKLRGIQNIAAGAADTTVHTKFLHHAVDQLCGKSVDFYSEYPTSSTGTDVGDVAAAYGVFFTAAHSGEFGVDDMAAVLKRGRVAEVLHGVVAKVYAARQEDIRAGLIQQISRISKTELVDFDWSLRTVISSDKASTLSKSLLVLRLTVRDGGDSTRGVVVELTKDELEAVLAKFEAIASVASRFTL